MMRLRATLKLRNEAMLAARERFGLTQKALSELSDVGLAEIGQMERLDYRMPRCAEKASRVAGVLELDVEQVVPEQYASKRLWADIHVVREIDAGLLLTVSEDAARMRLLPAPSNDVELRDLKAAIESILSTLSWREGEIIKLRYGLCGEQAHTLSEVGQIVRLTRERVRQIETNAIRKLTDRTQRRLKDAL
jgi:RNA polymerase sigma factor (sigma-70 family)